MFSSLKKYNRRDKANTAFLSWVFIVQTDLTGIAAMRANIRKQSGSDALWVDSRDRTSIVFKVRSCGGATIALSDIVELTTRLTYVVVLGASQV